MWTVSALWFVPLIFLYVELPRLGRLLVGAAAAASMFWQLALLARWYGGPASLYMTWSPSLLIRNSLIGPEWRSMFPSFYDFDHYMTYPPNVVAVIVALLLVAVGARSRSLRRSSAGSRPV
jgi:hypothetical protein